MCSEVDLGGPSWTFPDTGVIKSKFDRNTVNGNNKVKVT